MVEMRMVNVVGGGVRTQCRIAHMTSIPTISAARVLIVAVLLIQSHCIAAKSMHQSMTCGLWMLALHT